MKLPHNNSTYQNLGCRCKICREDHARVQRKWRAKQKEKLQEQDLAELRKHNELYRRA